MNAQVFRNIRENIQDAHEGIGLTEKIGDQLVSKVDYPEVWEAQTKLLGDIRSLKVSFRAFLESFEQHVKTPESPQGDVYGDVY